MAAIQPFEERIDELARSVGTGKIVARCEVDQPYAQNQHQTDSFQHNSGGRSHYLGGPLMEHYLELLEGIAHHAITASGSSIDREMIAISERLARWVLENAPKGDGELSLSGHPTVESDGFTIYDRPPIAPRRTVGPHK